MSNNIMHVYPNICMSNGHEGLAAVAQKTNKVNVTNLKVGEFCLFVNRAFTACKLFGSNNVLLHYKHPQNHCLDYKALRLLPEFYDGQNIGYSKALRQVLKKGYPHLFED